MVSLFVCALMLAAGAAWGQALPSHCDDAQLSKVLRMLGPVVSVGASTSGGLLAKSFPELAANQLCLSRGAGFASRHTVSGASKFSYLKKVFIEQRPKIVLALDHLHHSSKGRRFDADTRRYLDAEIAMLTLDCNHPSIDCRPGGDFHFVVRENYRPVVILGDIHAFYAVDCKHSDPFVSRDHADPNIGCIEDYDQMNRYLRQKAAQIPTLHIFSGDRFYRNLHAGLPFLYDIDGELSSFFLNELFWDGFHPRSEPGAQVFANLMLRILNAQIANGRIASSVSIPYIRIDAKHIKPFTGIVLIDESNRAPQPAANVRLRRANGRALPAPVFHASHANGWLNAASYERRARSMVNQVGTHPLVLRFDTWNARGEIVLGDEQAALLEKVLTDPNPGHRLLGGALITRE